METWKDDSCARSLKNKTIYVNYNNCCYKHPLRKRVRIWSYSGPHFPAFSRIRTEYGEILRILTLLTQWSWRKWNGNNHKGRTIFYHSWGSRHSIFFFFSSQLCSTRKHSYYVILIMLYQKTQLLCELISQTLCWLL